MASSSPHSAQAQPSPQRCGGFDCVLQPAALSEFFHGSFFALWGDRAPFSASRPEIGICFIPDGTPAPDRFPATWPWRGIHIIFRRFLPYGTQPRR